MRMPGSLLPLAAAALIYGCAGGARDVDYGQERGISADIDATYQTGPLLLKHGQIEHDEPYGAFPWQLDERHQDAE
ncbi:MAG TPA: hypothetical protein VGP50_16275 [Stellaceae bacterium]|jgi:hypothetical protein|nr:hypothetical protein [Stellaceae bacterium]